ncbi:protein SINE1 [Lycium ferocissimum]|uniref:protein SINE1 n=1 Tax=Lycium ferocissimum TaxID=112874 RepID=UPI00281519D2|nr:protein SINE1 [Lycium ferocissimum]
MGRSVSPILRRELENLEKDAESRKFAMKALKSYVKELDSKAIPVFLAQVSETKESNASSGEYTISLYEVLARVHGPKIVPQIDNIMTTIIKTLTSSAGSFALHQACSKVVPAIARYSMDPMTPKEKKRYIIHSLSKPLSDCLLGRQESLSSGAALCLKALVDSDNWRVASNEMVHEVCQRVAGALEKHTQTNSHMALVTSLAKHNSLIMEAYARLLIQSGLQILNRSSGEGHSQKRLSAIHMVNSLMKYLDQRSIHSELRIVIEEMEKCQSDKMLYVRGAAFEALQTAKRICSASEKGSKFERDVDSMTGSNFDRNLRDQSPLTASPESRTINSFVDYEPFMDSPVSINQGPFDRRSVNRKLWKNGGVDVSLKDGIFSEFTHGNSEHNEGHTGDNTAGFAGFLPRNGFVRSATPSPQRSRSHVNVESVKIFATPRKLIHLLQDANDVKSDVSERKTRRFRSPSSCRCEQSPAKSEVNGLFHRRDGTISNDGKHYHLNSESVSSTEDAQANGDLQVSSNDGTESQRVIPQKCYASAHILVFGILVIVLAAFILLLWIGNQDQSYNLVPT